MTAVTVIIVNYNAGDRLARAVECVSAQTFRDFEVIVADNGSTDGSADALWADGLALEVARLGDNLGFAAANNRAAERARGKWLAFLNPDAFAEPDWLAALMAAVARYPGADAFGSTQVDANDPARLDGAGDGYFPAGLPYRGHFGWPVGALPGEGECFAPCAAAALWRRETFLALGGFDERFFCYGEDVDLGFRLRIAGGRAVQVPAARVLHEGSGVTGRRSEFSVYHGHRNRVWTFVKNMPGWALWLALPFHLAVNLALLIQYALTGKAGAYLRAMKDAARGLGPVLEQRRAIQSARKARIADVLRVMTFSPLRTARRGAKIVPAGTDEVHTPRGPA